MTAPLPPSWQTPVRPGPAPGVEFAGHGARLGAYIIDVVILGAILSLLWVVIAPLAGDSFRFTIDDPERFRESMAWASASGSPVAFAVGAGLIAALGIFYFPYFWAHGGATPGMRITGIRVVNDFNGSPIGWSTAFLRLVGFWFSGAVLYLGYVWILIDSRRRGWHDLLAGTCVISSR